MGGNHEEWEPPSECATGRPACRRPRRAEVQSPCPHAPVEQRRRPRAVPVRGSTSRRQWPRHAPGPSERRLARRSGPMLGTVSECGVCRGLARKPSLPAAEGCGPRSGAPGPGSSDQRNQQQRRIPLEGLCGPAPSLAPRVHCHCPLRSTRLTPVGPLDQFYAHVCSDGHCWARPTDPHRAQPC